MSGTGDGLKPESLNELLAASMPQDEDAIEPSSPPGASLSDLLAAGDGSVLNEETLSEFGSTSSIFDEGSDEPIRSVDEIPDAIPNISDGGTEILARGRTEIQEFNEEFAGDAEVPVSDETVFESTGKETVEGEFDAHPSQVGGLLLNELEDSGQTSTVNLERTELTQRGPDPGSDRMEESFSTASESGIGVTESGVLDLGTLSPEEGLDAAVSAGPEAGNSGLSLSGMISSATTGTGVASSIPRIPGPAGNRTLLIALGGYAVIVTLLCLLLLSLLAKSRGGGQLESLPDVAPEPAGKMSLSPANAQLPAGHLLAIGESQRYGNLRVEPIRVTRGPLRFVYHGTKGEQGFKTDPVLKLWVRLSNESSDQAFVPIDEKLLFRRSRDNSRANNFVMQKSDQAQGAPLVMIHYDTLLSRGDWGLEGQRLGQLLQPGESIETYLPTTEEGIDQLSGDLIWRMHIRKGHSASGHGVTTLVEVAFRDDQIEPDGT